MPFQPGSQAGYLRIILQRWCRRGQIGKELPTSKEAPPKRTPQNGTMKILQPQDAMDLGRLSRVPVLLACCEIPCCFLDSPCVSTFVVYSYRYTHDDGRISYPLCFIFSSPVGKIQSPPQAGFLRGSRFIYLF